MGKTVCPRCGSSRIDFSIHSAGTSSTTNYYRTGVKKSWVIPSNRRKYKSTQHHKTIALCHSCGYQWTAYGEHGCLFYLICVMFFPITLTVLFCNGESPHLSKRTRRVIAVCFWIVFFCLALIVGINRPT